MPIIGASSASEDVAALKAGGASALAIEAPSDSAAAAPLGPPSRRVSTARSDPPNAGLCCEGIIHGRRAEGWQATPHASRQAP